MARNYDRQTVLDAIEGSGGVTLAVAARLGCEWHTAKSYIEKWESTKRAFADEGEKHLDRAESLIKRNIDLGLKIQEQTKQPVDSGDAKWLLSRKGKDRGYADKSEVEIGGVGGGAIAVANVELSEDERRAVVAGMLGLPDEAD